MITLTRPRSPYFFLVLFTCLVLAAPRSHAQIRQTQIQIDDGTGKFINMVAAALAADRIITLPDPGGPATLMLSSASGQIFSSGLTVNGGLTLGTQLSIANGGTGATSASSALTNLLPSQSLHNGDVLTSNGTSASWQTPSSGGTGLVLRGGFTTPLSTVLPFYISPMATLTSTTAGNVVEDIVPVNCTIDAMYLYSNVTNTPGNVDNITVTLYVNGSPTTITGTISCSTTLNTPITSSATGLSHTLSAGDVIWYSMTHTDGTPVVAVRTYLHAH